MTIEEPGSYFFIGVQKSNRKFSKRAQYSYSNIKMIVVEDKDGELVKPPVGKDVIH